MCPSYTPHITHSLMIYRVGQKTSTITWDSCEWALCARCIRCPIMIATLCVSVLHVVHNPLIYNIQGGPKTLITWDSCEWALCARCIRGPIMIATLCVSVLQATDITHSFIIYRVGQKTSTITWDSCEWAFCARCIRCAIMIATLCVSVLHVVHNPLWVLSSHTGQLVDVK